MVFSSFKEIEKNPEGRIRNRVITLCDVIVSSIKLKGISTFSDELFAPKLQFHSSNALEFMERERVNPLSGLESENKS